MNSFFRILPYLRPHRRKIAISFVSALLVAFLWGANLSIAFPIVKVLLEGQSIAEYVATEVAAADAEIAIHEAEIESVNARIATLDADDERMVKELQELARFQGRLSAASRKMTMMRWMDTSIVPWIPEDRFDTFACILVLLLIATVLKGICIVIQDVLVGGVVELTIMAIRKDCFRKLLKLDYHLVSNHGTGDLMSRFTNDVAVMGEGLSLLGVRLIREPLKVVTCILFAFYVNWRLTLMSLIVLPVLAVVFRRYGKSLKRASQHMLESMSRLYKVLEETLESFKVVLAYNNARRHRLQFHRESKTYFRKALRVVQIDALTRPTTELFGMTAVFVALVPSAYLILRGTTSIWGIRLASAPMDVAELAVLYALLAGVLDPVRKLSSVYSRLKKSAAATDRVFALMDTRSAIHDPAQTARFHLGGQTIEFREVGYTYPKQEEAQVRHPAVRNVNLKVSAGDAIAVVGENGSGKSTLINMLPRFFDADDGAILIDDVDIRTVKLAELRSHIAVVTQETQLFDDTIYENIRYGKPRATHEEVEAAARLAHVDQFLAHLPDGFATRIGEKGARLSVNASELPWLGPSSATRPF